jgi:hypothetical protein
VKPDLFRHLGEFEALGIDFEFRKLGDNVFNEAGFLDPDGTMITLIEARTFSPPARDPGDVSMCGYFAEFGIPSRDPDHSKAFWEQFGFIAVEDHAAPFRRISLTSDFLDVGLFGTGEIKRPVLTFVDQEMPARIARILKLGIEPSPRLPRAFDAESTALFVAPEGTPILLITGDL